MVDLLIQIWWFLHFANCVHVSQRLNYHCHHWPSLLAPVINDRRENGLLKCNHWDTSDTKCDEDVHQNHHPGLVTEALPNLRGFDGHKLRDGEICWKYGCKFINHPRLMKAHHHWIIWIIVLLDESDVSRLAGDAIRLPIMSPIIGTCMTKNCLRTPALQIRLSDYPLVI